MTDHVLDFDQLWNYAEPAITEMRFRELLPAAAQVGESYRLQLLTQIARSQGLQGRFDDAHRTLDEVEPLAKADPVVESRYLLERGRVYNSFKQTDKARPLFVKAWGVAQAAHEDFYAVDAAHMMAIVEPPDQQLAWNLKAVQLAERSASARTRNWLGSLYNNIGWTYHDAGQYDQALVTFQKVLDYRIAQGKEPEIRIARWCIARTLRSLKRIPDALAILRDLEMGEHDGYVDEEIAECLLVSGKSDDARPYFAAAYKTLSQERWLAENAADRLARLKTLGI